MSSFEYEDMFYLQLGTMQLLKLGMLAPNASPFAEPATLHDDVINWLEQNDSSESEDLSGMPTFKFPDRETMLAFTLTFNIVPENYEEHISKILTTGFEKIQSAVESHKGQGIKNA